MSTHIPSGWCEPQLPYVHQSMRDFAKDRPLECRCQEHHIVPCEVCTQAGFTTKNPWKTVTQAEIPSKGGMRTGPWQEGGSSASSSSGSARPRFKAPPTNAKKAAPPNFSWVQKTILAQAKITTEPNFSWVP